MVEELGEEMGFEVDAVEGLLVAVVQEADVCAEEVA